jgi:phosphoserine phosphatase RsbU/P
MKIRIKLIFIIGIIFMFAIFIGLLSAWTLNEITNINNTVTDGVALISNLRKMYGIMKDLLLLENLELTHVKWIIILEEFRTSMTAFLESPWLKKLLRDEELNLKYEAAQVQSKTAFAGIEIIEEEYQRLKLLGKLGNEGLFIQSQINKDETLDSITENVLNKSKFFSTAFENTLSMLVTSLQEENVQIQSQILFLFLITTITGGLLAIILSFIFANRITRKIHLVGDTIKKVSEGDFTTKLDIKSKDEFGVLSDDFNFFIRDLKGNVESVLDFLRNVQSSMTDQLNINEIAELVVESCLKDTNADGAAFLLVGNNKKTLKVSAIKGIFPPPVSNISAIVKTQRSSLDNYFRNKPIEVSNTVLGDVVRSGKPIFIKNSTEDKRLEENTTSDIMFISSIIAMPIIISKKIFGVLAIEKVKRNSLLTDLDYTHMSTFADYAALTIENYFSYMELIEKRDMERELKIASEIQKNLLPTKELNLKTLDMAAFSNPAKEIGGDYYDTIKLDKNKTGIIICDVAGKGIPAALIMTMIRTILHLIASAKRDSATILTWLNKGILTGKIGIERFATAGFLVYDDSNKSMIYANAAHLPLLIFRNESGKIQQVDAEGLPLGIDKNTKYSQKRVTLNSGDLIVLYTDGIAEAMNPAGEQFTYESLTKLIKKNAYLSSDKILEKIRHDLDEFTGDAKQHDDQTLIVMKIL